jgi:hypothetical protein
MWFGRRSPVIHLVIFVGLSLTTFGSDEALARTIVGVGNGGGGASSGQASSSSSASRYLREGLVQGIDVAKQTIVINAQRFIIGPPYLALVDKRPNSDGKLTLAGVKVGMSVRYQVSGTGADARVVELIVQRDPPETGNRK